MRGIVTKKKKNLTDDNSQAVNVFVLKSTKTQLYFNDSYIIRVNIFVVLA